MSNPAKRILITPLNWGLGHATRCIPIIRTLLKLNVEVIIATDGGPYQLLTKEFPHLKAYELPGYNVNYKGNNFGWTMLRQGAKVLAAIAKEQKAVQDILAKEKIDAIISDNRFGCYAKDVPSVFITHQVNLISPMKAFEAPVNLANHQLIKKFDEVWIPDFPGEDNLAGKLSFPANFKKKRYLGALTRMHGGNLEKSFDIIAVVSGPEPKRSEFEHKIFAQSIKMDKRVLVVRGLPDQWEFVNLTSNVEAVAFLTSKALNEAILSADVLVSRSGYSTILDLVQLGKPALLVPTPGQTEQVYLAEKLDERGLFASQNQDEFNLAEGIEKALQRPGLRADMFPAIDLEKEMVAFLSGL
ncbi:MAG: hypothetical protein KDC24_07450 [Saprospiraceae bacterium]|nr:hypothetical protein [Saprospiraceae bacterium]